MTEILKDQLFESLVDTISESILILDKNLIVTKANRSFFNSFKVKPEDTIGQLVYGLGNRQWDIPQLRELLESIIPEKTSINNYEIEHIFETIGKRAMLLNARQVVPTVDNEPLIFLAIEDITEKKRLENLLIESEYQYRRLFETANDGILLLEKSGLKINKANPAIDAILGYSNEECVGKIMKDIGFLDNWGSVQEIIQELEKEGIIYYSDTPVQKKTGELVDTDIYMVDRAKLVQCNVRDISVRKQIEKDAKIIENQLLQVQKMDAIGILAGGIAHDFNNYLGVILGNTSYALSTLNKDNELFEIISDIQESAKRSQNLSQQLLTFAKGGEPIKKATHINNVLEESCRLITSGVNIKCEFNFPNDLWAVEVDQGQISQVLSNMLINARHAMPKGGIITIRTENVEIKSENSSGLSAGRYIKIAIKDQGTGISKKNLPNIFDPYFTTKQKGSGLGLTTVYSIIKRHGGQITVDSELDRGTVFNIYIPASSEDIVGIKDKEEHKHAGRGKVLIMDDEDLILDISGMILNQMGYETFFAKDGVHAIQMYKDFFEAENPFDLVILDLTIPGGVGGAIAIAELLKIDPKIKAIVSSGYSNDPVMANFQNYGFAAVLPKPYTMNQLAELLNKIFDEKV